MLQGAKCSRQQQQEPEEWQQQQHQQKDHQQHWHGQELCAAAASKQALAPQSAPPELHGRAHGNRVKGGRQLAHNSKAVRGPGRVSNLDVACGAASSERDDW